MDMIARRKADIARSIAANPTAITISRTQKVASGGGFKETTSTVGPYTVRIYQNSGQKASTESKTAGTEQTNSGWGLLANAEADIKAEETVKDVFDVAGLGRFTVVRVTPQIISGTTVGYQAELILS
jgi:hypothetical protein